MLLGGHHLSHQGGGTRKTQAGPPRHADPHPLETSRNAKAQPSPSSSTRAPESPPAHDGPGAPSSVPQAQGEAPGELTSHRVSGLVSGPGMMGWNGGAGGCLGPEWGFPLPGWLAAAAWVLEGPCGVWSYLPLASTTPGTGRGLRGLVVPVCVSSEAAPMGVEAVAVGEGPAHRESGLLPALLGSGYSPCSLHTLFRKSWGSFFVGFWDTCFIRSNVFALHIPPNRVLHFYLCVYCTSGPIQGPEWSLACAPSTSSALQAFAVRPSGRKRAAQHLHGGAPPLG